MGCQISFSQITITSNDMPAEGVHYQQSNANPVFELDLSSGENITWDYSDLESTAYDSIVFVSVDDAPFAYQLLFNNVFIQDYYADYATTADDFEIPGIASFTNNYEFFQNNNDDYRRLGRGSSINDFPTVSENDPIDIVYRFPMEYENIDSSYTEIDMNVPGLLFFHQEIDRINIVDGWGTLVLPIGEFEVLKVRTELYEIDSIHITTPFEFGLNIPLPDKVEYKWFAQGEGIPVLTITENAGIVSSILYKDYQLPDPIDTTENSISTIIKSDFEIFPNPTSNELTVTGIDFDFANSIEIVNLQGQIVFQSDEVHTDIHVIDTSELPNGRYILRVFSKESFIQKAFLKID